jgi:HD-like signal output (HDOD) protein
MQKLKKKTDILIKKIEQIPTLPAISQKVLEIVRSEDASIDKIAPLVEQDPALASNVLKVANSSFYGCLSRVSSIDHALVVLGINETKSILLGFSVHNFFSQHRGKNRRFDHTRFWRHGIICSQVAKLLGRQFRVQNDSTLFLVGLIHDIGKIVLDQYLTEDFEQIIERVSSGRMTFSAAEKEVLGATHYQIAAKLLKQWHFPNSVIMPVLYHHAPWYDKGYEMSSIIVYLANILTHLVDYSCSSGEKRIDLQAFTGSREFDYILKNGLDFDQEMFVNIISQIRQTIVAETDNIMRLFD